MTKQPWTSIEDQLLCDLYADVPTADVAALLGRKIGPVYQHAAKMGLHKSAAYLTSAEACRLRRGDAVGTRHRYAPGHKTWNAGLKGWSAVGTEATRFKPGTVPPNRQQVGALRINSDGQLDIKLSDGLRSWVQLSHYAWFLEHGQWPQKGYCLRFRDGDMHNPDIKNLHLVTRAENMRLNSHYTNYPPEVARLVQLKGQIARQVNRINREYNEGQTA